MKRITIKQRERDVLRSLSERRKNSTSKRKNNGFESLNSSDYWRRLNAWFESEINNGLNASLIKQRHHRNLLEVTLPERMDFNENYDRTLQCITAIQRGVELLEKFKRGGLPKKAIKIARVDFDNLKSISTSAALVLTATIARWDDSVRNRLTPQVDGWDKSIYVLFCQLGFFELFSNKPDRVIDENINEEINIVKYMKGECGNAEKTKIQKKHLKLEIANALGSTVPKWHFLNDGLSEAVTNVSHHAYPSTIKWKDASWFLTGSYNRTSGELKIAFFDHGVGIPNTLPKSGIWENILGYMAKFNFSKAERSIHAKLLEAALSIERTQTGEDDRGKGLRDFLTFIQQRGQGYLSIFSYYGLYKHDIVSGNEKTKSVSFERALKGTLIIWSANIGTGVDLVQDQASI